MGSLRFRKQFKLAPGLKLTLQVGDSSSPGLDLSPYSLTMGVVNVKGALPQG